MPNEKDIPTNIDNPTVAELAKLVVSHYGIDADLTNLTTADIKHILPDDTLSKACEFYPDASEQAILQYTLTCAKLEQNIRLDQETRIWTEFFTNTEVTELNNAITNAISPEAIKAELEELEALITTEVVLPEIDPVADQAFIANYQTNPLEMLAVNLESEQATLQQQIDELQQEMHQETTLEPFTTESFTPDEIETKLDDYLEAHPSFEWGD